MGKGIDVVEIKLGELTVNLKNDEDEPLIESITGELGFQIIQNRDDVLVEEIKKAVIELIHDLNNVNSIVRKSDYLVEKLGMSYQQLSKTFSNHEPVTLEKYIILQKIEKIKELIDNNEYTLSEISYMMDYSSIQYLSAQFRQITGLTPSEYKKSDHSMRKAIDEVY
ncbi:MAG: helix-turn-helix transcriptional regulator [Bacteroidales bacterium]|nr:helix-turn-helix transcriptional regulator [Bacteroidales bacterium]